MLCLQHAYRDGQLEEVALRHLRAEDGRTIITKNIRYSLCLFCTFASRTKAIYSHLLVVFSFQSCLPS